MLVPHSPRIRHTPWHPASEDLVGVGTTKLYTNLAMYLPAEHVYLPQIQVEYTARRTGGSGFVQTWLDLRGYDLTDGENKEAARLYTSRVSTGATTRVRRVTLTPAALQTANWGNTEDRLYLVMGAAGSGADSEFSVTNIRTRLVWLG